jgi:methionyl-tRNA formyltransferase
VARSEGESVVIAAREGGYRVDRITPPGKRTMTPAAFLRGRHSSEGRR